MNSTLTSAQEKAARYGVAAIDQRIRQPDAERATWITVKQAAGMIQDWISDEFSAIAAADLFGRVRVGDPHNSSAENLWLAVHWAEERGAFVREIEKDVRTMNEEERARMVVLVEQIISTLLTEAVPATDERMAEIRGLLFKD